MKSKSTCSCPIMRSLAEEYKNLSQLSNPSDIEIESLAKILDLASSDKNLELLIDEIDEILSEELNFTDEYLQNQRIKIADYIVFMNDRDDKINKINKSSNISEKPKFFNESSGDNILAG